MDPLFWLVALIIFAWAASRLRSNEISEFEALAKRLQLRYSVKDDVGLKKLPLGFFRQSGIVRHVMQGQAHDTEILAFLFSDPDRPSYNCALTSIPFDAPELMIQRKLSLPIVSEGSLPSVGELEIVRTESIEFERRFRVASSDRRFAVAVLEPEMMVWLLNAGASFELYRHRLLAYEPLGIGQRNDLAVVIDELFAFRDRLPNAPSSDGAAAAPGETALADPVFEPRPRRHVRLNDLPVLVYIAVLIVAFGWLGLVMIGLFFSGI